MTTMHNLARPGARGARRRLPPAELWDKTSYDL